VDHENTGAPPTGRFPIVIEHDQGLPTHTIYRPVALGDIGHPILVWGEGACADAGLMFPEFLSEIASHGVVVIADGPPEYWNRTPQTTADGEEVPPRRPPNIAPDGTDLIAALDWIFAEQRNADSHYFGKLDTANVAAMGMSCGGLMAYGASSDPRVTTLGVWNSGLLEEDPEIFARLHQPLILITGNEGDVAYPNGKRDFETIPDHVPMFYGVYPAVGHSGTYREDNGGEFGRIAVAWLKWQLFEDTSAEARGLFVGDDCALCTDRDWRIGKKNLR
jgi:dienelactone hydrolase